MAPKKTPKKEKASAPTVKKAADPEPQVEESEEAQPSEDPPAAKDDSADPPPIEEPAVSTSEMTEPRQEEVQTEVSMEVTTNDSTDTTSEDQPIDEVPSESPNKEATDTVTVNCSSESQQIEMEVDPSPTVEEFPAPVTESPAPVAESPAPVAESPVPVEESPAPVAESPAPVAQSPAPPAGESPTPPQGPSPPTPSGTPTTLVQSSFSPETPTSSGILIQTFESPVTPMFLERAGAGVSVMVPFDQQSLMSSTIGSPGVRKCGICGKVYRNRNGLYKHRLAKHPQLVNANKPIHCQQPGCGFDCHRLEVLREHITEVHKIPMQIETGTFVNLAEFIAWKERLEKENCANFVKTRGASGNTMGVHTKHRYYCSRSGFHNSKSTGKRRKVTTKMGAYCTAGINVLEHKSTGEVQAEACITHHGHPIQLEYLKIPPKDKREIASKIVRGKSWDQILEEYHESGLKQGTRSSILSKKDLMNIQRIVKKHLPASEQGDSVNVDQQVEIDTSDPDWIPPTSATCSDSETEIAVESLQRLGEVATTGVPALRDGLLNDLDRIAAGCKSCQDRDSLLIAGSHIKAALGVFQGSPGSDAALNGGSSRTRPVREQIKEKTAVVVAGGDGKMAPQLLQPGEQVQTIEIGENAMNLLESMEKDVNSDVRVPASDSQEGEDDMPVITYRLVPAAAENATCPLDSLATTSQYRTLGIRLTKEMLYTLSLICEKHQMDRLLSGGNLINREEVEIICSKLPDEVIDADMTSIRVLLERDAWYLLESAVETKRTDWKCGLCDKVTGKLHMIRCCSCNNWFHWVCVEIEEQPTEEWFCPGCILRKRMQAIQTRQSTKKVAAQQGQ